MVGVGDYPVQGAIRNYSLALLLLFQHCGCGGARRSGDGIELGVPTRRPHRTQALTCVVERLRRRLARGLVPSDEVFPVRFVLVGQPEGFGRIPERVLSRPQSALGGRMEAHRGVPCELLLPQAACGEQSRVVIVRDAPNPQLRVKVAVVPAISLSLLAEIDPGLGDFLRQALGLGLQLVVLVDLFVVVVLRILQPLLRRCQADPRDGLLTIHTAALLTFSFHLALEVHEVSLATSLVGPDAIETRRVATASLVGKRAAAMLACLYEQLRHTLPTLRVLVRYARPSLRQRVVPGFRGVVHRLVEQHLVRVELPAHVSGHRDDAIGLLAYPLLGPHSQKVEPHRPTLLAHALDEPKLAPKVP
mmetsp:Transcript_62692/g.180337  ORF Transcript_62692/g.180337 Transcript_62692/m.180337 type:complete len:361 (+) Transcript_62692:649-1731(+)